MSENDWTNLLGNVALLLVLATLPFLMLTANNPEPERRVRRRRWFIAGMACSIGALLAYVAAVLVNLLPELL